MVNGKTNCVSKIDSKTKRNYEFEWINGLDNEICVIYFKEFRSKICERL